MDKDIPQELIEKYLDGTASREERLLLESSINRYLGREVDLPSAATLDKALPRNRTAVFTAIGAEKPHRMRRLTVYVSAAAAVLIMAVASAWLFWGDRIGSEPADIAPGSSRATLTLADGTTVELSSEHEGIIVGAEDITYTDGSALDVILSEGSRDPSTPFHSLSTGQAGAQGDAPVMLVLTTPKGGMYSVTLPDGSKVWLNAASTLRYPSRFNSNERVVFLEGEAYFGIRPQVGGVGAQHIAPFNVQTANQVVQVLGTEFNISAYPDEDATKTTLVEGKVKVTSGTENGLTTHDSRPATNILTPGQQATTRNAATTIQEVDTDQHTAWRDGYFKFQRMPITEIMQQLARWYDVEVQYEGAVRSTLYSGRIARTENISAVLRIMELTDAVRFEIDVKERRIIVKH